MEGRQMPQKFIETVQIDSLAVMKIVEHIESDRMSGNGVLGHGTLVGLTNIEERRVEVTNTFPRQLSPLAAGVDGDIGMDKAELEVARQETQAMLRKYQKMSLDYEAVGFYESFPYGAAFNRQLLEDMDNYQQSYEYNIVLVYDPVKTCEGQLYLKAYRLSEQALKLLYIDMSPDACKAVGLSFSNLFEEIPIVIKNSHLISVMLAELKLLQVDKTSQPKHDMEIAPTGSLAKCMRGLMTQVEALNKSTQEYNRYTINKQKAEQMLEHQRQKRELENDARKDRGEPPLSMDELHQSIKWPILNESGMLPALLAAADMNANADFAQSVCRNNMAKLQLLEALVDDKTGKMRSSSSITAP